LTFWLASCRLFVNPLEAENLFERAFEQFVSQGQQEGALLAWANVVRSILIQWTGFPRLDRWIARFASLQPEGTPYPRPEIEAQVAEAMAGALVWRQPGHPQARQWLQRAIALGDQLPGSSPGHAVFLTECYLTWLGDLVGARTGLERLRERASRPGAAPSLKLVWYMGEAMMDWIEGRVEACRTAVRDGLALAEREGVHLWDGFLIFQGIHNDLLSGNLGSAREQLHGIRPMTERAQGLYLSQYWYHSAWHLLLAGEPQKALGFARRAVESSTQEGGPFPEGLCCLLVATILHELGQCQEAEVHRVRAAIIADAMDSDLIRHGAWLLAAQIAFARHDRSKGLDCLRHALDIGCRQGLTEYPGWHAQAIAKLYATALEEGIEVLYVQDVIRKRWLPLDPALRPAAWPCPVKIFTLGKFQILLDDKPLKKSRKAPHRLLDILKAIIAFGIHEVDIAHVMDAIWPEAEADHAQENFEKGIRRLRRLLGHEQAILMKQGKVSLNGEVCWVDIEAFERFAREGEKVGATSQGDADPNYDQRAAELYGGPYLGQGHTEPWAQLLRDRLQSRFTKVVMRLNDYWQSKGETDIALDWLQKGIELDPLAEPLYCRLMRGLSDVGRQAEALALYRRCRHHLMKAESRDPSPETQRILRTLQNQR